MYRADGELEPDTKRARGGDSGGPVIPPLPTLDEETMRQLNTILPPPDVEPPTIDASSGDLDDTPSAQLADCPMDGCEVQEDDAQGRGSSGPVDPVDARPLATRPDVAQLDTMEVDGGSAPLDDDGIRPCIPPLPVMTADVLAQLDAVLPPPEAAPRSLSSSSTHDSERAHHGETGATATVDGRPDDDYNHVCDGGVVLPDTGQYRVDATLVQVGTKRSATAMHSPMDDGCQASPKRARIGPVGSRSHSDALVLTRTTNTTTTTTGADRAAPTATPGSVT